MDQAETVLDALGDPVRRAIVRRLLARDGQCVDELTEGVGVPRSRLGRHVRTLERAGLVSVLRTGRERQHWLQTGPLAGLDGWFAPFRERWTEATEGALERPRAIRGDGLRVLLESHVRASSERVWLALISPRATRRYFFGCRLLSSWLPRSGVELRAVDGTVMVRGTVLDFAPRRRLAFTWQVMEGLEAGGPVSRVAFTLMESDDRCRVTLEHAGVEAGTHAAALEGWRLTLDSLKSLMETGASLHEVAAGRRAEARATRVLRRKVELMAWKAERR